jgi:D-arabinose 1-dehydrogenase-like Zn-dependent alcohol dehydrogenase
MLQPGLACGHCEACLTGHDNRCHSYDVLGSRSAGGYAEFVVVPRANVIPLPDHVDFVTAAAFPLTFLTAWHMLVSRLV